MRKNAIIIGFIFLSQTCIFSGMMTNTAHYNCNNLTYCEKLIFEPPKISDYNDYISIEWGQTNSYLASHNKPLLPKINKQIILPFGSIIGNIEIQLEFENIILEKKILPANFQEILTDNDFDETYNNINYYPNEQYSISEGAGLYNGEHVLFLQLEIFTQYLSSKNILRYPKEVDITVSYNPSESNYFTNDEYDMVIIIPEKFQSDVTPLAQHKNNVGLKTIVKTVEEIYSEYEGRDKPEQIKYFIKNAIEEWGIDYVFLIGNIEDVPMRKTNIGWPGSFENLYSDHYYADIYDSHGDFSSWDSNNNNKFAEFEYSFRVNWSGQNITIDWNKCIIDKVDLYSDISIGRILCSSSEEVKTNVEKIIEYEQSTSDQDWFNNIILMGGSSQRGNKNQDGEIINSEIGQIMSEKGFTPIYLWTSLGNFNPFNINQEISKGAGLVSYTGHGFENGLMTYSPSGFKKHYVSNWIDYLKNNNKLPIIFFDACLTARPDFTLKDLLEYKPYKFFKIFTKNMNLSSNIPPFAMKFLNHETGGSIACIGATQLAYNAHINGKAAYGASILNINFFKSYNQGIKLSEMLLQAQNEYINSLGKDYLTIGEFMLLGDPSLKLGGYQL